MSIKKYHSGDSIRSSFDMVGKNLSASNIPNSAEAAYSFHSEMLGITLFYWSCLKKIYLILTVLSLCCSA